MRQPHFRRETEHQRAQRGSRKTRGAEDDAAVRAIREISRDQPQQRAGEKNKSVEKDAAAGISCQRDKCLRRRHTEKKDGDPAGNIVRVESPDILGGDRIGKQGAVAVELQLVAKPDDDEEDRAADSGGRAAQRRAPEFDRRDCGTLGVVPRLSLWSGGASSHWY